MKLRFGIVCFSLLATFFAQAQDQKSILLINGFLHKGNGEILETALIGVRSVLEGFSFIATGLIITGFYTGFLTGSVLIPIFLKRVGHIRVFAALASLIQRIIGAAAITF